MLLEQNPSAKLSNIDVHQNSNMDIQKMSNTDVHRENNAWQRVLQKNYYDTIQNRVEKFTSERRASNVLKKNYSNSSVKNGISSPSGASSTQNDISKRTSGEFTNVQTSMEFDDIKSVHSCEEGVWVYDDLKHWMCGKPCNIDKIWKLWLRDMGDVIFCYNNSFPVNVGLLTNLVHLDCSHNKMTTIASCITNLINLKEFYCNNNELKEITPKIGALINLEIFHCCNNNIVEIPIEITKCIKMKNFDCTNNRIKYVMPQIKRFLRMYLPRTFDTSKNIYDIFPIPKCVKRSIVFIMKKNPSIDNQLMRTYIYNNKKISDYTRDMLIMYCDDATVHPTLNITFEELLVAIYDLCLFASEQQKDKIFAMMNEIISYKYCKYLTGRIIEFTNITTVCNKYAEINITNADKINYVCEFTKMVLINENEASIENYMTKLKFELTRRHFTAESIIECLSKNC